MYSNLHFVGIFLGILLPTLGSVATTVMLISRTSAAERRRFVIAGGVCISMAATTLGFVLAFLAAPGKQVGLSRAYHPPIPPTGSQISVIALMGVTRHA